MGEKDQLDKAITEKRAMDKCNNYNILLKTISKYTTDIREPTAEPFACGSILGFKFRLFQERVELLGGATGYESFLCIKTDEAKGTEWPALYDPVDIDAFVLNNISKVNVDTALRYISQFTSSGHIRVALFAKGMPVALRDEHEEGGKHD